MNWKQYAVLALILCFSQGAVFAQDFPGLSSVPSQGSQHLSVRLISDHKGIAVAEEFKLAICFDVLPGHYTYTGEKSNSHMPTSILLQLPEGMLIIDEQWPEAEMHYGREGEEMVYREDFMVVYTLKAGITLSGSQNLGAKLRWQVCNESLCMVGTADLKMSIDVNTKQKGKFYALLNPKKK